MIASINKYTYGLEIRISGRLDSVTSPVALSQLQVLPQPIGKLLVFNLEGLDYVSSAGLRVILGLAKRAKLDSTVKLVMTNVGPYIYDVFVTSGCDALFDMVDAFDYAALGEKIVEAA